MEELREFLVKLIPEEDKLQHYYIGSLGAILLNIIFNPFISAGTITIGAVGWEIYRKYKYGYSIDKKDIFYSILLSYLLLLI